MKKHKKTSLLIIAIAIATSDNEWTILLFYLHSGLSRNWGIKEELGLPEKSVLMNLFFHNEKWGQKSLNSSQIKRTDSTGLKTMQTLPWTHYINVIDVESCSLTEGNLDNKEGRIGIRMLCASCALLGILDALLPLLLLCNPDTNISK